MIRIPQAQSSLRIRQRQICRPLSRLPQTIALALLPTLLAACQPRPAEEASPTEVRSDGRFRWTLTRLENVWPTQQFDWLDDETILLIGVDKANRSGLFAWDHKGKARLILPGAYRLCFDGETWRALVSNPDPKSQKKSYTRYRINPSDLSTTRIGPMAKPPGGGYSDEYTCNEEPYRKELIGKLWVPLRPRDGFLVLGSDWKRNQEAFVLEPRTGARAPLSLGAKAPTTTVAEYSNFAKSYILYDTNPSRLTLDAWNRKGGYTMHTLTAPNHLRAIEISSGPWSGAGGGDREIEVAKSGIVITSKAESSNKSHNAGVYIVRAGKEFTKIDDELIESPVVSPNGCNLLYKRSKENQFGKLTKANLCPQATQNDHTHFRPLPAG